MEPRVQVEAVDAVAAEIRRLRSEAQRLSGELAQFPALRESHQALLDLNARLARQLADPQRLSGWQPPQCMRVPA